MDRRGFLQALSLPALSLPALSWGGAASLAPTGSAWALVSPTQAASTRRLIVVFMRGAVDGLSLVVPYNETNYYRQRSTIAIGKPGSANGAIDLDGQFGLHPALAPLMPFWKGGSLAFVHAAGSPDPTRSHFDGQDNIESGTPGNKATPDGWLNRLEGVMPVTEEIRSAPARAVSIGSLLPRIFKGRNSVATVASGAAAARPTVLDRPRVRRAFEAVYGDDPRMGPMFANYVAARAGVVAAIEQADPETMAANNGAASTYAFATDATRLGAFMRRDPRVQLGFLAVSGWDTHANQGDASGGQLARLLSPFARGMSALARSLGPVYADTTIAVISEFGRTVAQNGNAGTDHGYGNVMWLMGGPVAGGKVHGEWPGLDDAALHEGRDLALVTDYRSVLAQICARHLNLSDADLSKIFPDMPMQPKTLQLIKA
jgi:uncharacterized protein (DUF1501 family)